MEKVAVIVPTRGDRPEFLANCIRQIKSQTIQPKIYLVDFEPVGKDKDITKRYKKGCAQALKDNIDVVLFWEDDDFYHPTYLEWMLSQWRDKGKPELFGINETYYYHIGVNKYAHMKHNHSSAFTTLLTNKAIRRINWPLDREPFLDMKIWKQLNGITIPFGDQIRAIGIKHGLTKYVGGGGHRSSFKWTSTGGENKWLKSNLTEESYNFYMKIHKKIKNN